MYFVSYETIYNNNIFSVVITEDIYLSNIYIIHDIGFCYTKHG